MEFTPFPKLARWSREIVITEKLDGTNASIYIGEDGTFLTGSRTRWITPENDNYGFSRWAHTHKEELMQLGHGHHFGEWWGEGIQRGYDLKEKRFSLFNTHRWNSSNTPKCVSVVPVLYFGPNTEEAILLSLDSLVDIGSFASYGFMQPEGIVIYHTASKTSFKKTIEKDDTFKGVK